MKLIHSSYGKARVRVMKILRSGDRHTVKELIVAVKLEGDFEASYTKSDNSRVVPTDTMKNTVQALALEHLRQETEEFGIYLAEHFVKTYAQVSRATIRLTERSWQRMSFEGRPHAHSFTESGPARPFAEVCAAKGKMEIRSGVEDLVILKSTESGFEGFSKDKYTTLPETRDRIFATQMKATWAYRGRPALFSHSNFQILDAMLKVFAETYSPSAQVTLFQMGEAALKAVGEIESVQIAMPNKHCLLVNLSPFGLENKNQIFLPTDEPHGLIEGTVTRE